jgi:hypothetical protein
MPSTEVSKLSTEPKEGCDCEPTEGRCWGDDREQPHHTTTDTMLRTVTLFTFAS